MIFTVICIGLLFTISGCGGDQQKITQLEKDTKELKSEIAEKNKENEQLTKKIKILESKKAMAKAKKARLAEEAKAKDEKARLAKEAMGAKAPAVADVRSSRLTDAFNARKAAIKSGNKAELAKAQNIINKAFGSEKRHEVPSKEAPATEEEAPAAEAVVEEEATVEEAAPAEEEAPATEEEPAAAAEEARLAEAPAADQTVACDEWSVKAQAEYKNGNFQEALDLREKVVQQDGCDEALRAKNQYLAGYIYQKKLNNLDKAKDAYQKVIDNYASSKYVAKAEKKLNALQ